MLAKPPRMGRGGPALAKGLGEGEGTPHWGSRVPLVLCSHLALKRGSFFRERYPGLSLLTTQEKLLLVFHSHFFL